jgi:DHA2 family multidrug resistance protein-like MFS transporter
MGKGIASVLIGVVIATCDISLTNTALPTIARELGIDAAASIWVVNIYYLTVVASLLPLAALGEIHGHRRVFLGGLLMFVVGSIACGLAWSLPSLVAARAMLGLGGAAISAVTPALIRFIFPPEKLGRGLGVYAMVVGVSFTAGPTIASAILSVAGWQAIFLVNVPFGLAAFFVSWGRLPETTRNVRRFDLASAALCSGLFCFLLLGLSGLSHRSDWRLVLISWLIAAGCGYGVLQRENGHPAPILALDLFRIPLFSLSAATSIAAFAIQGLAFVALPFLLQLGFGYSQVEAGFLITPWPATLALMTFVAAPLADRVSPGLLGGIGLLIVAHIQNISISSQTILASLAGVVPKSPGAPTELPIRRMPLTSQRLDRIAGSATTAVRMTAARMAAEGRDVLRTSSGEPDFDTPQNIKDAAIRAIQAGDTRYTDVAGTRRCARRPPATSSASMGWTTSRRRSWSPPAASR